MEPASQSYPGLAPLVGVSPSDMAVEEIACALCCRIFTSEREVKAHVDQEHPEPSVEPSDDSSGNQAPAKKKRQKVSPTQTFAFNVESLIERKSSREKASLYACSQCDKTYPGIQEFQDHLNKHLDLFLKKFPCPECGVELPSESSRQAHLLSHFSDIHSEFTCRRCERKFASPDDLQKHLFEQHTTHLLRCSLCSETFDSKISIQVHFVIKHSNEKRQLRCKKCNAIFKHDIDFEKHIARDHLGLDTLGTTRPCMFCGKTFSNADDLQAHIFSHMKHFNCLYCDKVFHLSSLLEQHIKSSHLSELMGKEERATNDEPTAKAPKLESPVPLNISIENRNLNCPTCSLVLPSENELMKHKTTHLFLLNIPRCTLCNAVFGSPSNLAAHMFEHKNINVGNLCCHCSTPLVSEERFYQHFERHLSSPQQESPDSSTSSIGSQTSTSNYIDCIVCKQPLTSAAELQTHAKFHTHIDIAARGYRCSVCYQTFQTKTNLYCKVDGNGCPFYICGECKNSLQTHFESPTALPTSPALMMKRTFFCPQCPMVFGRMVDLVNHSTVHLMPRAPNNTNSFQCIKCHKVFSSELEVQEHVSSTHLLHDSSSGRYACQLCSAEPFDSPARLQRHLMGHSFAGKDLICPICHVVNKGLKDLQTHVLIHRDVTKPHKCSICSQSFFFPAELEHHSAFHAGTTPPSGPTALEISPQLRGRSPPSSAQPSVTPEGVDSIQESGKKEFACGVCSKVFGSEINVRNHMKMHNPVTSNDKKCSMCPEVFPGAAELQAHHFSAHKDSDPQAKTAFTCELCSLQFPCFSNLQGHLRTHNEASTFPCPECDKVFGLSKNLQIHMRCHSGDKPYLCPICPKRFTRKENRKVHMKCHNGVKPYLCPHCGKLFSRKSHAKEHLLTHSPITGTPPSSQPLLCGMCSHSCESIHALVEHFSAEHGEEVKFTLEPEELLEEETSTTLSPHLLAISEKEASTTLPLPILGISEADAASETGSSDTKVSIDKETEEEDLIDVD